MDDKKYPFRREDDGSMVLVDFETNMSQDAGGYITLPDGVRAKRCLLKSSTKGTPDKLAVEAPVYSDSLACSPEDVDMLRAHARMNGFTGIEFLPDPACPEDSYVCRASSRGEMLRYAKLFEMSDRGERLGSGATLSPDQLAAAENYAKRIIAAP